MWYIILYYIVILKLPVSANKISYRSLVDMSNIYRTNMMRPVAMRYPSQPGLVPRQQNRKPLCGPVPVPGVSCEQPTTCVNNNGQGALHGNQQRVCYTIPRWPDPRYQITQASQIQRYPQTIANPKLRQMMTGGMVSPGRPAAAMVTIRTGTPQPPRGPLMRTPQGWTPQRMVQKQHRNQPPQNATMKAHLIMNQQPPLRVDQFVTGYNGAQSSYYYPRVDYPYFQNQQFIQFQQGGAGGPAGESTSTAPPSTPPPETTTSTMPPYPGGVKPDSDENSGSFLLCGNKAKCNKYVWTTKKKSPTKKKKEEELVLW
ncbi:hypothetical protein B5X24_HaOG204460 [Helicoverpa armigera]|uniref:Uncharacterized protein n=1 Tax=Helicoverpa armigera TaxID=29058 RepID=A0A2W1BQH6_HELAM|nr:hypothetical protein B5X24_HaOG204460 [Helicoverpa armigera]